MADRHYARLAPLPTAAPDPECDVLLKDIAVFLALPGPADHSLVLHRLAASIYLRRNEIALAVHELHAVAEAAPTDLEALHRYGDCLRQLAARADGSDNAAAMHHATTQVVQRAGDCLTMLTAAARLSDLEAERWRTRFAALLEP
jgi:hypothetical protein